MQDLDLSARGKAAYGALCAACCGLPMLVVLGIVSVGVAFTVGAAVASAITVLAATYLVSRRRLARVPPVARRVLAIGGAALSGLGLWLAAESVEAAPAVLSIALAALAMAALLALSTSNAVARTA